MKRIPVLIADDHPLFREGVRALLLRDGRFEVVAEVADGESALRELRTSREADVLKQLVPGATATEIAATLGISPRTVETCRNQLVTKFSTRNAVDLVRRAVEAGFVLLGKPAGPADI